MQVPNELRHAERQMGNFPDIEQLYADLVPYTYKYNNGMIAKTDRPSVDMRPLWKAVETATIKDLAAAKQAVRDNEIVCILYISTYVSADHLKSAMAGILEPNFLYQPGVSADRLRMVGGMYAHIQIRPGRSSKDTAGFTVKSFNVPANPAYLELINTRIANGVDTGRRVVL